MPPRRSAKRSLAAISTDSNSKPTPKKGMTKKEKAEIRARVQQEWNTREEEKTAERPPKRRRRSIDAAATRTPIKSTTARKASSTTKKKQSTRRSGRLLEPSRTRNQEPDNFELDSDDDVLPEERAQVEPLVLVDNDDEEMEESVIGPASASNSPRANADAWAEETRGRTRPVVRPEPPLPRVNFVLVPTPDGAAAAGLARAPPNQRPEFLYQPNPYNGFVLFPKQRRRVEPEVAPNHVPSSPLYEAREDDTQRLQSWKGLVRQVTLILYVVFAVWWFSDPTAPRN